MTPVKADALLNRAAWEELQLEWGLSLAGVSANPPEGEIDTVGPTDEQIRGAMSMERVQKMMDLVKLPRDATPEQFRAMFPVIYEEHLPSALRPAGKGGADEVEKGTP